MISKIPFGRTGHNSTRTLFGAAAFWTCDQAEADRTLELLLKFGINHIDTAPNYGNSEERIGPWMAAHRKDFFLATKTKERTYAGAKESFEQSLERLRVDSVDLLQLHNLVDPEQWEVAMGPGGALEWAVEARDKGMVRYIGVTGHGLRIPAMHLKSLERFDFDSVLIPCNYPMMQNPQYRADFDTLRKVCTERNVAVQTIKSIARGLWVDKEKNRETWYEPLEDQEGIDRAVHYVLGHDGVFLNTVGDPVLLPKVLDAASRYQAPPADAEMQAMITTQGALPLFTEEFHGP